MRFIRAPYIEKVLDDTKVLAKVDGNIVMVENKNQLAMSFHPELTSDTRIHEMFFEKNLAKECQKINKKSRHIFLFLV